MKYTLILALGNEPVIVHRVEALKYEWKTRDKQAVLVFHRALPDPPILYGMAVELEEE